MKTRKNLKLGIFAISAWLYFATAFFLTAKGEVKSIESVSLEHQLSQSHVSALAQDDKGFLWIGTTDGLNRYDGYTVKIYNKQNSRLNSNNIYALEKDSLGNIWIGTSNGLSVYWAKKGSITTFFNTPNQDLSLVANSVWSLAADDKGGMWVGTKSGISYYNPSFKGFESYQVLKQGRSNQTIYEVESMLVDKDGSVWAGTSAGKLAKFDPEFEDFDLVYQLEQERLGSIDSIQQDAHGKIWLVVNGHGLFNFSKENQKLIQASLSDIGAELEQELGQGFNSNISRFLIGSEGKFWLATVDAEIVSFDQKTKQVNNYTFKGNRYQETNHSGVTKLLRDKTGVIWIGTGNYLKKLNPETLEFNYMGNGISGEVIAETNTRLTDKPLLKPDSIFGLLHDKYSRLWIGGEANGLVILEKKNNQYVHNKVIDTSIFKQKTIYSMLETDDNRVVIQTENEIYFYDVRKNNFSKLEGVDIGENIFQTSIYHEGVLWTSSTDGLWKIDQLNRINHYKIFNVEFGNSNAINDLEVGVDEKGKDILWLGMDKGIFQFDIAESTFKSISEIIGKTIPNIQVQILTILLDKDTLWIGTYGNGLVKLNLENYEITSINSSNSKIHDTIYALNIDKQKNIWAATGQNLYRITPDLGIVSFTETENQPIREFNDGSAATAQNGEMFFGGINGIIGFAPLTYRVDEHAPEAVLTKLEINHEPAIIGEFKNANSQLPITETEKITIYSDSSSVEIEFSALHFTQPEENQYQYKLEGYEQDWQEVDALHRKASYNNLDTGNYLFKLKVANGDGIWNEKELSVALEVKSSLWWSAPAFIIYGLILSSIIIAFSYLIWTRLQERGLSEKKLTESEERLKLSLWGSGDELWDWEIESGALHLSNEWEHDFPRDGIRSGYSMQNSNIHPNDLPFVRQALQAHLSGKSEFYESTYRIKTAKQSWTWVLDRGKSVEFVDEKPIRMAGTLKNITELKSAEQQLRVVVKSFESISDAVWILDEAFNYIAINKAFTKITGFEEDEVLGRAMKVGAIHQGSEEYFNSLRHGLNQKDSWEGELDAIRKNGQIYPIEININVVKDEDGEIVNYVGVFSDITYRKKAETELRRLATTDQLTNLPNRSSYRKHVDKVLFEQASDSQHALLFIDLDNFKRINDSLGHAVGDELLINVSRALESICSKHESLVARLGGDEFVVFLERVETWNQPAKVAQDIIDKLAGSLQLSNNEVVVSPSIGIVMYPENGETSDELLKNSDTAMYYAKKKGKNTYQFYTKQMNEQAKMRLNLENELRQAIEKDEFLVYFQPKVSLKTGKISSMEALVRWRNPERGIVLPNEFIPLAEESGFIIPISQKVIEKTCLQIRDWQNRGIYQGKVAINLSAVQFYHENLWETVKNALHLAKIDASSIEFEITEGMVMQDLSHSIKQMKTLQDMGIDLALDDFGVGYSSLGNLKDFPINTLKIDRSFVWDLEDSERDRSLVASIVTLAHNLDIKVVAEGVESLAQAEALKAMNCEEIQGFIFSKPVPHWEMEEMLTDKDLNLENILQEMQEDLLEQ